MSLDLEHLYEGMGARADEVALLPLESIRRRARRRRNLMIAGTAVPVVAVVAALSVVWTLLAPAPQPFAGQPFLPFDRDDPPALRFDGPVADATTITIDNTAYASWSRNHQEYAAAIDLETRKPLWGPVAVGPFAQLSRIWVSRGAVLIALGQELVALDPANGQAMWRLNFLLEFDKLLLYDDVAIASLTESRDVAALELRTGATRWASGWTTRPLGLTPLRRPDEFGEFAALGSLPVPADHRFVTHYPDGLIQVRDAASGVLHQEFLEKEGPISAEIAFDGRLYYATRQGVVQVDLEGRGEPRRTYPGDAYWLTPCGQALLCVLGDELVVIDPARGRELWRRPAVWQSGGGLFATSRAIRAPLADGYAVYDLSGKRLLTIIGNAGWVDDEHLLAWETGSAVSVYSVRTGKSIQLGEGVWGMCSWNRTMLTCPTDRGISVWRYRTSG